MTPEVNRRSRKHTPSTLDARREMMQAWADYLDVLRDAIRDRRGAHPVVGWLAYTARQVSKARCPSATPATRTTARA